MKNRHLDSRHLRHHAFVIEAEAEAGIEVAQTWIKKELGMTVKNNPDVAVLRYGLLSVDDVRRVCEIASQAPFAGEHKAILISASRVYHEAQNALLKLFEEPPRGTYMFLVLPTLGSLLSTLLSRVAVLNTHERFTKPFIPEGAELFQRASREERSVIIKKLTSGKDEEERRELREEAITIVNGVEAMIYRSNERFTKPFIGALLSDIAILRGHLYDRSAPVRMILEHLALVLPRKM
ncbi:MAG: hypothetical protein Q7R58_00470 [bacterium]|nr:hypothetical protein [bacterium]